MPKKKNITKEQTKKAWEYFESRNWPRNTKFPKKNGDSHLDRILEDTSLTETRKKALDQLRKWKLTKYEDAGTILSLDRELAL
jgi:hypothetical protein